MKRKNLKAWADMAWTAWNEATEFLQNRHYADLLRYMNSGRPAISNETYKKILFGMRKALNR